ncbi:MAG: endonuclease domain-containing protein [Leptospirales bacterium]|nr:endonuclease domain-containing protein [Leptospirales bacterium]
MIYNNELTKTARSLRQRQTPAEKIFWQQVKNRQTGYKVIRQKPLRYYVGKKLRYFIADFYCQELNLVIELDGKIHQYQQEYDEARDCIINQMNLRVIRIENETILNNSAEVIKKLFPPSLCRLPELPSPDLERGRG